jgi:arylsulfatase A-like enzyme
MHIDVAPPRAELVGVTPPPLFLGRSLRPALAGEALPERPVTAEVMPAPSWKHDLKMLIAEDDKKIIYRISDGVFELYDLAADPDEQQNLASAQPELLARMKERITRWMESEL